MKFSSFLLQQSGNTQRWLQISKVIVIGCFAL